MNQDFISQGLDFLILTPERIDETVAEMVRSGRLTAEEAARMREGLARRVRQERERFQNWLQELVRESIGAMDLVPRTELNALEQRLKALEGYVDEQARKRRNPRAGR